jgi:hypothetical protein
VAEERTVDSTWKKVAKGCAIAVSGGALVVAMLPHDALSIRVDNGPLSPSAGIVSVHGGPTAHGVELVIATRVGTVRVKLGN